MSVAADPHVDGIFQSMLSSCYCVRSALLLQVQLYVSRPYSHCDMCCYIAAGAAAVPKGTYEGQERQGQGQVWVTQH